MLNLDTQTEDLHIKGIVSLPMDNEDGKSLDNFINVERKQRKIANRRFRCGKIVGLSDLIANI